MKASDFGMGFFGKGHFSEDARRKIREEWNKMPDSEKLELMNQRMNAWGSENHAFNVENIDARCEKWMKLSPEEKEQFVSERKSAFQQRGACMTGFFSEASAK
ncbi:MAG: hypothetical protein LBQ60_20610 [Bacteroidales bacterium]|jgi:ribosomal protein L15E|nr:hypothetical protein [Bacteroidales bacterium]